MQPEQVLDAHIAQWTVQAFTRLLATYAIMLGVFVMIADEDRFAAPQYATTLQLPGFPDAWGAAMLLLGIVALAGTFVKRCKLVEYGMFISAIWELFFTLSVADAVFHSPEASPTASIIHGFVGIAFVLAAMNYRSARKS